MQVSYIANNNDEVGRSQRRRLSSLCINICEITSFLRFLAPRHPTAPTRLWWYRMALLRRGVRVDPSTGGANPYPPIAAEELRDLHANFTMYIRSLHTLYADQN